MLQSGQTSSLAYSFSLFLSEVEIIATRTTSNQLVGADFVSCIWMQESVGQRTLKNYGN